MRFKGILYAFNKDFMGFIGVQWCGNNAILKSNMAIDNPGFNWVLAEKSFVNG